MISALSFLVSSVLTPIGRYAGIGLVATVALTGAYYHVKGKGYAECKAQWNAANIKGIEDGATARRDGDADAARGLRDGFDRDE